MSDVNRQVSHRYDLLAELLEYPTARLAETLALAQGAFRDSDAGLDIEEFVDFAAGRDLREIEELFTSTFDLCAPCCLDVGWQLFGETYKRGEFLVRMRGALRDAGIAENAELPDHLPTTLRLLARLTPDKEPAELAREAVLPAVAKMLKSLGISPNPYGALLRAVTTALCADFAIAEIPPPPEQVDRGAFLELGRPRGERRFGFPVATGSSDGPRFEP